VSGTEGFSIERPGTGDFAEPRPEQQQNRLLEATSSAIAQ